MRHHSVHGPTGGQSRLPIAAVVWQNGRLHSPPLLITAGASLDAHLKLNSILVVIDSFDPTPQVLAKAMVMALHFGARLELFLCDSEQAYVLKHAYDQERHCLANGRSYLES